MKTIMRTDTRKTGQSGGSTKGGSIKRTDSRDTGQGTYSGGKK